MSAINELLDKAKNTIGLGSDIALAERLGVTRAMVSKWRSDDKPIADERIAQICALAKVDGPEWMARIHAEKAQSPAERALWSKMLTRLAAAAIFIAPFSAGANEKAPEIKGFSSENASYVYYVRIVRTWMATSMARLLQPRWLLTRSLQHA
jgi:transcriptional regulator with XRE-family HTH domain